MLTILVLVIYFNNSGEERAGTGRENIQLGDENFNLNGRGGVVGDEKN